MTASAREPIRFFSLILKAAAIYNVLFGCFAIFSPFLFFKWSGMQPPVYPELWQCIGMIVGVYGLGYWIASTDPLRHWPIVFVGLLGKILGPLGFIGSLASGRWTLASGVLIITNDLLWWVPFGWILFAALSHWSSPYTQGLVTPEAEREALNLKHRLFELSHKKPQLVVFLRHTGCTFCKETLAELSSLRFRADASLEIHTVNMASQESGRAILDDYNLHSAQYIADPSCALYRAFNLTRGSFSQLFGFSTFKRGLEATWKGKHVVGRLVGDGLQMPGVFLLKDGEIVRSHVPVHAGERIKFLEVCSDFVLTDQ